MVKSACFTAEVFCAGWLVDTHNIPPVMIGQDAFDFGVVVEGHVRGFLVCSFFSYAMIVADDLVVVKDVSTSNSAMYLL